VTKTDDEKLIELIPPQKTISAWIFSAILDHPVTEEIYIHNTYNFAENVETRQIDRSHSSKKKGFPGFHLCLFIGGV
jgi:hypothetical protein